MVERRPISNVSHRIESKSQKDKGILNVINTFSMYLLRETKSVKLGYTFSIIGQLKLQT